VNRAVKGYWSGIALSADASVAIAVQSRDEFGNLGIIAASKDQGLNWVGLVNLGDPRATWADVAVSGT